MLDALEAAGVEIIADCRRGECGVCAVDVVDVDGRIDHRDVFLSDHQRREGRKICPCVSRAVRRNRDRRRLARGLMRLPLE